MPPAQLGGAAGTLAALGDRGPEVVRLYAERARARRARRFRGTRTALPSRGSAAALALTAGVLAKIALDVVLLAQTEVGERSRKAPSGASSTMPHKRNPVGAVLALACARGRARDAATLHGALVQEHERAAGAWQAEWDALSGALAFTGGAVAAVARALDGLEVDAGAHAREHRADEGAVRRARDVRARRRATGDAEARERVERAIASGRPLREELDLPDGAFDVEAAVATAASSSIRRSSATRAEA